MEDVPKVRSLHKWFILMGAVALASSAMPAVAADKKPNILLIMSDDVGISNISAYSMGLVGYKTPNIDRIAKGGMMFTDYYGEQSCTAGRSALISGIHPVRTGLTSPNSGMWRSAIP